MARSTLPVHPRTGLRALGVTPKGRVVWPILGAEDNPDNPVQPPDPTKPDPKPELTWDDLRAQFEEQGLNPGQIRGRLDASRKWEERAKAIKPEELAVLREKAAKHDALEFELMSDKDKSVAEAAQQARWAAEAELMPRLVHAEFRVAAAGRIDGDKLPTILEPLDLSKFLTDDGDVDTAKVIAFVDGISPAKGPERQGPSSGGAGRRGSYTTGSTSVASGREMFASRHKSNS